MFEKDIAMFANGQTSNRNLRQSLGISCDEMPEEQPAVSVYATYAPCQVARHSAKNVAARRVIGEKVPGMSRSRKIVSLPVA